VPSYLGTSHHSIRVDWMGLVWMELNTILFDSNAPIRFTSSPALPTYTLSPSPSLSLDSRTDYDRLVEASRSSQCSGESGPLASPVRRARSLVNGSGAEDLT
jgi:hypothetical protein